MCSCPIINVLFDHQYLWKETVSVFAQSHFLTKYSIKVFYCWWCVARFAQPCPDLHKLVRQWLWLIRRLHSSIKNTVQTVQNKRLIKFNGRKNIFFSQCIAQYLRMTKGSMAPVIVFLSLNKICKSHVSKLKFNDKDYYCKIDGLVWSQLFPNWWKGGGEGRVSNFC